MRPRLTAAAARQTVFMRRLLEYAQDADAPLEEGIWWTVGLVCCEALRVIFFAALWGINYRTGIRLRSACVTVLYRKLMRLPSLGDKSVGQVGAVATGAGGVLKVSTAAMLPGQDGRLWLGSGQCCC